jgi:argininosuccinate synthase
MDAYLEEELYDLITYCIQNGTSSPDYQSKKERAQEIGSELFSDGGVDAMENMYFAIQNRIKEEIGNDAKPYRSWWNGITDKWKY